MPHQGMGSARMLPMQGLHVRLCPVCQNGMFGRVWGKSAPGNQDATHQRTFVPGEVVCRKGARGKSVYSVCKGAVKLEGPLVVSCGNQRRQSVVVVAPCGHVGKSQSGLSTCPCGLVVHELEAVS